MTSWTAVLFFLELDIFFKHENRLILLKPEFSLVTVGDGRDKKWKNNVSSYLRELFWISEDTEALQTFVTGYRNDVERIWKYHHELSSLIKRGMIIKNGETIPLTVPIFQPRSTEWLTALGAHCKFKQA